MEARSNAVGADEIKPPLVSPFIGHTANQTRASLRASLKPNQNPCKMVLLHGARKSGVQAELFSNLARSISSKQPCTHKNKNNLRIRPLIVRCRPNYKGLRVERALDRARPCKTVQGRARREAPVNCLYKHQGPALHAPLPPLLVHCARTAPLLADPPLRACGAQRPSSLPR